MRRAAAQFYHWAADEGVALQHILYDPGEVAALIDFARRGVIPERGRIRCLFWASARRINRRTRAS